MKKQMIIKNKQNSVSLIFHTLGTIFKENDKRKNIQSLILWNTFSKTKEYDLLIINTS